MRGAQRDEPGHLGVDQGDADGLGGAARAARPDVQVHAVLAVLQLRDPLEQHARAVGGDDRGPVALHVPGAGVLQRVPEHLRPEGGLGARIAAVDHDLQLLRHAGDHARRQRCRGAVGRRDASGPAAAPGDG
ncbi:hypothetical protein CKY47_10405 [Saccharothrix yanglingensis]|uniref:Uncharacterized protein n=1 Tax=Saccharothrix yanglingensis TaxID=659496 RepID=A0ABU0WZ95_9PSEU|nr:hypothetical protein [Saccharothrix yanglingensis]